MKSTAAKFFPLLYIVLSASSLPTLAAVESINIEPLPFNAATGVSVETAVSGDEPIVSMEYRWFINGEEVFFENSARLPGNLFKRGNVVEVEVTPVSYTGERLAPLVTGPFEATNAPPVITSEPPEKLTETGFRYQVIASDPDGDALTFKLENAPDMMTINTSSGLIQWPFDLMSEGVFPVIIKVEDGYGGLAEHSFELQMTYEEVAP